MIRMPFVIYKETLSIDPLYHTWGYANEVTQGGPSDSCLGEAGSTPLSELELPVHSSMSGEWRRVGDCVQSPVANDIINRVYVRKSIKNFWTTGFGKLLSLWSPGPAGMVARPQRPWKFCPPHTPCSPMHWLLLSCILYDEIAILSIELSWVPWVVLVNCETWR